MARQSFVKTSFQLNSRRSLTREPSRALTTRARPHTVPYKSAAFSDSLGKPAPETVKTIWILMKQWHQLDLMQSIGTSLKTDNCAGTSALIFYRPDDLLMTTQQCQSTEVGKVSDATAALGRRAAPHVRRHSSKLLPASFTRPTSPGGYSKFDDACDIAASGLKVI